MKRVLFITPHVPNSSAAGEKFTRTTIEKLSQHYIIDLIYYKYAESDYYVVPNNNVNILETIPLSSFRKVINIAQYPIVHPFFSVRFSWKLLIKLKKYVGTNKVDMMVLDHAQTYIYGKFFPETQKLLIAHDVVIQRVSRQYGWLISKICYYSERFMLKQKNSNVFTFSGKDIDLINKNYGIKPRFTSCNIDRLAIEENPVNIEDYFVFFGQWKRADNYHGLLWFINEVYPYVKCKIKVIGGGLSSNHKRMISDKTNIEILGFVDNPYKIIANSKALISPLFSGAGVKVKVLESLACGTPVIGGEIAFEGVPDDYSSFLVRADTKEEYIYAINNLNINMEKRVIMKKLFIDKYVSFPVVDFITNSLA